MEEETLEIGKLAGGDAKEPCSRVKNRTSDAAIRIEGVYIHGESLNYRQDMRLTGGKQQQSGTGVHDTGGGRLDCGTARRAVSD